MIDVLKGLWRKVKALLKPANNQEETANKSEFYHIFDTPTELVYNCWFVAPTDQVKLLRLSYRKERSQQKNWSKWKRRRR